MSIEVEKKYYKNVERAKQAFHIWDWSTCAGGRVDTNCKRQKGPEDHVTIGILEEVIATVRNLGFFFPLGEECGGVGRSIQRNCGAASASN